MIDISLLTIGSQAPEIVNVFVEISRESHVKYELDLKTNLIRLDRILHSPLHYPFEYGFIPETHAEDGDHLDAFVIVSDPLIPGCFVSARVIGVLDMDDGDKKDFKIITVAQKDPRNDNLNSITDLSDHIKDEYIHFFSEYKHLEKKNVHVNGFKSKDEALKIIRASLITK